MTTNFGTQCCLNHVKCTFRLFCLDVISFHAKLVLGCILGLRAWGLTPLLMLGSEIKPGRDPGKGIEPLLSQVGIKPHNEFQSLRLLFSIQLFHHTSAFIQHYTIGIWMKMLNSISHWCHQPCARCLLLVRKPDTDVRIWTGYRPDCEIMTRP